MGVSRELDNRVSSSIARKFKATYIFSITRKISPAERPSFDGNYWMIQILKRIIKQFILYSNRFSTGSKEPQNFSPFCTNTKPQFQIAAEPFFESKFLRKI